MCGINGLSGNHPFELERMNKNLSHRGPDFAGTYTDNNISLGHTLLSIRSEVGISGQPYTKPHSPWILLFNGQLYNTTYIKQTLGGDVTNTDLDTELLFRLIEKFGWNFIDHIQGMFAIALYHEPSAEIRLYRDPTGQKNIYYYTSPTLFTFSSEIKGLLPNLPNKKINEAGISLAAQVGYLPGHLTIIDQVYKLRPSEFLTYNLKTGKTTKNFFKSLASDYFPDDFSEAISQLVAEHLQSKQLVSINLSGGLDSSLLLYEMARLGYHTRSYSSFFEIENSNEKAEKKYNSDALLAARLAKDLGADHQQINISATTYLNNLKTSYSIIEEPNYNISVPIYYEMAKQEGVNGSGNRVVFSGDGGDEIFGGYPHYQEAQKIASKIKTYSHPVYRLTRLLRDHKNYNWRDPASNWFNSRQLETFLTQSISQKEILTYWHDSSRYFIDLYGQKKSPVYDLMLMDRVMWMASENFIRSDKLYMDQSMEMRCPLSYHPFRLYIDQKITNSDYINEDGNKIFLRRHYQNKLPDYIVNRGDKTGWRAPVALWYNQQFQEAFLSLVGNRPNDIIDWQAVREIIKSSPDWPGKEIHFYLSLASVLSNLGL